MKFHYIAAQHNGKIIEGNFDALEPVNVLEYLANQGLRPISLKVIKGVEETSRGLFVNQAITISDKVFLVKYLSLMLKVGTDLFKAIDILIADFDKPAVKSLLIEIRGALEKGQPFYSTFVKHPKIFSPTFINLIKAGEVSGNLERIFAELSVSLEREENLRREVKSALIYPIILLTASFIVLFLLVGFALPKVADVFIASGIKPPLFSQIVLSIGLFIGKYVWILLGTLIVSFISIWYLFLKTIIGKKIIQRFMHKIPMIRNVLKQLALQRFSGTLSSLLKAGLSILDALEITAQAVGYDEIKDSLIRISREGISKGLTMGEAFKREIIFPRVVVNLMAISEKAGHVENILSSLADFYEAEARTTIKTLLTFLEPALLLIMGVVIGTIALAVIVPIYQLTAQF